jgi:polyhydroxyalkanoate synthesis regulator phasin
MLISSYKNVHDKQDKDIEIDNFLEGVRTGRWEDIALEVRNAPSKDIRDLIKKRAPLVTPSGSFAERKVDGLRKHSGFIAIDIDNLDDPAATKKRIGADPYLYACFISISGQGLCLIVKIDGTRHLDAFNGIAAYLYNEYQLIVDQSGKDVSRARFVSYDPFLLLNGKSATFKKYLAKKKEPKHPKVLVIKTDFDAMIKQMDEKGLNLCEDYSDWIRICYAIVSEFQEYGREYFHTLSSTSSKYNSIDCDAQYDACLKNHNESKGKKSSIGTIYYHAKQNGIDVYSEHTKSIARFATSQKAAGLSKEAIIDTLEKQGGFSAEDSKEIVDQIVSKDIKFKSESVSEDIASYIKTFDLKKNVITRKIELDGKAIDDSDINSIFLDSKAVFKESTKDLITSIIFSNRIPTYNPLHEFFEEELYQTDEDHWPNLTMLIDSVITDTPNASKFIQRWLISIVASAYGNHSALVLVFCGAQQGTGKTHWFRYLLPKPIRYLYAESKMDAGKDDEILMCGKLIINDDEYGGKSKKEDKRLKELTSKEFINVREPYGRVSVDLRRLAVFCGTSNDTQILSDATGNRRIIGINILGINQELYNQCDKVGLWRELFAMYQMGAEYRILGDEILELNEATEMFKLSTPEDDLINQKLQPGSSTSYGEWMSLTEIQQFLMLETKFNYLNTNRIGQILTKLGFVKERRGKRNQLIMMYFVSKNNTVASGSIMH